MIDPASSHTLVLVSGQKCHHDFSLCFPSCFCSPFVVFSFFPSFPFCFSLRVPPVFPTFSTVVSSFFSVFSVVFSCVVSPCFSSPCFRPVYFSSRVCGPAFLKNRCVRLVFVLALCFLRFFFAFFLCVFSFFLAFGFLSFFLSCFCIFCVVLCVFVRVLPFFCAFW